MPRSKILAATAVLAAVLVEAGPSLADGGGHSLPRLTVVRMVGDATPLVKLVMIGLMVASLAALASLALGLASPARRPGAAALTGVIAKAGPLFGALAAAYGLTNSFIGVANTNTTNLAVIAPGLAEAILSLVLGFLAGAIGVVVEGILRPRASTATA